MKKAVVKFWGSGADAYGMPTPYHSYYVVASPWNSPGSGIASVVPLSTNAPLSRQHFLATSGGEDTAFNEAVTALEKESGNATLKKHIHIDP